MTDKKETPLDDLDLDEHHCTVDLRLEKLGMVPFFRDLTEEQLRTVNEKFTANHFAKGETIYRQGDPTTMLRVVVAGAVKLVSYNQEGEGVLLDMLKAGDFFGHPAAKSGDVYNETAQTQINSCILSIRLNDFRDVMSRFSSIAMSVLDIMNERLNESRQRIRHLSTLPVKKRIAHILVTLGNKFGERKDFGLLIQLPLSRRDLANMAGTSPETASRVMSEFQNNDLISSGRQWVAIKNKPELLRISAE